MNYRASRRMEGVQAPVIPAVMDLVRGTPGTISLAQGVVYYGPPPQVFEAIRGFHENPENHRYKAVEGIPPLLRALEAKLRSDNGVEVGPGNVIVTTAGGNMAFLNAILALADPGDEIVLQRPYYFNHEMAVGMASCRAVIADTDENYQLRPDLIRAAITPRTRAVVTISPNNPTGAVYPEAALREVNALCRERGVYHVHDEAYEYFVHDGARHFSPASIPGGAEHTISLHSLSKAYGFASWRLGWMVIPKHLHDAVRKIQDTNLICAPMISQVAAVGALAAGAAWVREKVRSISEVRRVAIRELEAVADLCAAPRTEGAFYSFVRVRSDRPPMEIVERLVREHRVAVLPGEAFGAPGCSLRVAFGSLEKETAVEGLGRFVRGLRAILKG